MRTHADVDAINLALDRAMAAKLSREPLLFTKVKEEMGRWRARVNAGDGGSRQYLERWQRLVDQGMPACLNKMTEESEEATELRQASPFVDILTPQERMKTIRAARVNNATRRS